MLLIDTYSCSQTREDNMDGNSLKLPCPSATKIGANHTAHSRLPQSARTAPALHITKFSRSSTSLPLPLKRHPHQSCVSLLTHRQKASPLFRHILANEKFGVIFTFARHLAQPGELWPLPVRACHESPFMVALGIRKLSPPVTRKSFLVVFGYGSRCEDRVCRVLARYDHFSAIRSVFWLLLLCLLWVREGFAGVSFDSDYSGEGDASFLFF
jgi:hypothetical protein